MTIQSKMRKTDCLAEFRQHWECVIATGNCRPDDVIAKREAWNNYTDALCKEGLITNQQYDSWTNPF